MKNLLTLSAVLAFGGLSHADEAKAVSQDKPCPEAKCDKAACADKTACSDKELTLTVSGLDNEANAEKASTTINAINGAKMCGACSTSGTVSIKYDPAKVQSCALKEAIANSGLTVTGQKISLKVSGMTCGGCANHLTQVLAKTEGVKNVDSVCHKSGTTVVTFDPKKTSEEKIESAVNATSYKVVKTPEVVPAS